MALRDLVRAGVLEQVARRAGLERRGDLVLLDERRDGDDVRLRVRLWMAAMAVSPSTLGISRSISTTSGLSASACADGAAAVRCLANDLHVVLQLEEAAQPTPNHLVVVDQQDPDASGDGVLTAGA